MRAKNTRQIVDYMLSSSEFLVENTIWFEVLSFLGFLVAPVTFFFDFCHQEKLLLTAGD